MGEAKKRAGLGLKAYVVPYSSVVGSSVVLRTREGQTVAQLAVILPGSAEASPDERRRAAEGLSFRIVELWNSNP